jgi:hypothetical protein
MVSQREFEYNAEKKMWKKPAFERQNLSDALGSQSSDKTKHSDGDGSYS